ncbi:MAG: T9SS type A sorting domain-containing protein [Saprospiraceae bacterium]|nr:T9SS type A sorting domain-containing protein [Saprospiraceae bacterium]MBP7680000.1 T9SS type A sorting domain-containing protein [Saprospiraceae bacterium]
MNLFKLANLRYGRRIFGVMLLLALQLTTYAQLSITVTTGNAGGCGNNGKASAYVTGGTMPYGYHWNTGATAQTLNDLAGGTYYVTVTDATGATIAAQGFVNTVAALGVTYVATREDCVLSNNGSATAIPYNGTPPYTYQWSNGQTAITATGLDAGTYTVTVTDATGCTATTAAIVAMAEEGVWIMASHTNVTCFGGNNGTIHITAMLGVPPYTYTWSNGAPNSPDIANLAPGTYSVTVSDTNGCADIETVIVTQPPVINLTVTANNAGCNGGGSASAEATGGTPNYTYVWSNGTTGSTIGNLAAGTYTVTATDANGCTKVSAATVTSGNGGAIAVTATSTPTLCAGSTGIATASASGGTAPYTYVWSTGATGSSIGSLAVGTYSVTATSSDGCSGVASVAIISANNANLAINVTSTPSTGCSGNTGTATASASGGAAPYTYIWNTGATGSSISSLGAGTYSVTATDANGCAKVGTTMVTSSTGSINVTTTQTATTCSGNTGTATASASGGTAPYTYIWSNGATSSGIGNLAAGTYTVTATSANGCSGVASVVVTGSNSSSLSVNMSATAASCNSNTGTATASASGGTAPYTYIWSNGATGSTIGNLAAGAYSVTATDANGCTKVGTTTVGTNEGNATIGDFVWNDLNGNGIQDAGEPGIGGFTITLTGTSTSGQSITQTYISESNGHYQFSVPAGTYKITSDLAFTYNFTTPNVTTGTEATDSDINPTTAMSNTITIGACQNYNDLDVGVVVGCIAPYSGGTIGHNQTICHGVQPAPIVELSPALAGNGDTFQYIWMQSLVYSPFNSPDWVVIPGVSGPQYQPPVLTQTTYFVRCAYVSGCPGVVTESNVITITVQPCPLIGTIEDFRIAETTEHNVNVSWQSRNEVVGDIFDIERSFDGIAFTTIGTMAGHGAQSTAANYFYQDETPTAGFNYYRIRMKSLSTGHTAQSDSRQVMVHSGTALLLVSPNPSNGYFSVTTMSKLLGGGQLQIVNMLGQEIERIGVSTGDYITHNFDLTTCPKGIYLLRATGDKIPTTVVKLIKQ